MCSTNPPTIGHNGDNSCQSLLKFVCTIYFYRNYLVNNWPIERRVASLCALYLCQMNFQLEEVEGEISLRHFSRIDFLRASWAVTHFMPSLAKYARKGVTLGHHQRVGSKKSWFSFPKNMVNWIQALSCNSLSTITCDIHLGKAMGGAALCAFGFTLVKLKYCDPIVH